MHIDKGCTLLVPLHTPLSDGPKESDLIRQLESPDDETKIVTLKQIIVRIVNGEVFPKALMAVIKYCLNSENHVVKKLTLLFWEVVERKTPQGKLLPEMILVCNAMKNNLEHPNEYIRGNTLRLLTKLREPEILEPLVPSIIGNLSHRHSYVRKNALMSVMAIHESCPDLIPDIPILVEKALSSEYSPIAKRNALLCLTHSDLPRALAYLNQILPSLHIQGNGIILQALDLMKRAIPQFPTLRGSFLAAVYELLTHPGTSSSVVFEATNTLLFLSKAPAAGKAALQAYYSLLLKDSDNNLKLVIVDRVAAVAKHSRITPIVQATLLELLKAVQTPDSALRSKVLDVVVSLCTAAQAPDVVAFLKKELQSLAAPAEDASQPASGSANVDAHTVGAQLSLEDRYRELLVQALYRLSCAHALVVTSVAPLLAQHLHAAPPALAGDIAVALRDILHTHPPLRVSVPALLAQSLHTITAPEVLRASTWLVGEFTGKNTEECLRTGTSAFAGVADVAELVALFQSNIEALLAAIGDAPLVPAVPAAASDAAPEAPLTSTVTTVLADGTYATQTVTVTAAAPNAGQEVSSPLRQILLARDGFTASAVAVALTKLLLRWREYALGFAPYHPAHAAAAADAPMDPAYNYTQARVARLIVNLLRLSNLCTTAGRGGSDTAIASNGNGNGAGTGASTAYQKKSAGMWHDSVERITACLKLVFLPQLAYVADATGAGVRNILVASDESFALLQALKAQREADAPAAGVAVSKKPRAAHVHDFVAFRQLGLAAEDAEEASDSLSKSADADLQAAATGVVAAASTSPAPTMGTDTAADAWTASRALTGCSDPVYVEGRLRIAQCEIMVELTVTNMTDKSLQNAVVDLHTSNDLLLTSRPPPFSVAKGGKHTLSLSVRVRSTESASIMGDVILDSPSGADKIVVTLAPLHVDLVRYIAPATCSDVSFRAMWAEFEWENKVPAHAQGLSLADYLQMVVSATNMRCLTPTQHLTAPADENGLQVLVANLYAVSIFGEEALMNVSVELNNTIATLAADGTDAASGVATISGYIRIRARTQGIALGLGDLIASKQRMLNSNQRLTSATQIVVENA